MALNTQFAGMPWLTQPADPIDSLAKGASAGGQIASTMARRRAEGMQAAQMESNERQRAIDNDIRRKEVSALMTWRQAQASKEMAKLESAAAKAASEKEFWDKVGNGMEQWRAANPDAGSPDAMDREAKYFQGLVRNNWHMRGSGQNIPAPLLKAPMPIKDPQTATQRDSKALVDAENSARMARGEPPMNPAEETARLAEVLGGKVSGKTQSIKEGEIIRQVADEEKISGKVWTDEEKAKRTAELRLQTSLAPKSQMHFTYDKDGGLQIDFGPGASTVGTQTKIQTELANLQASTQQIESASSALREKDFGISGKVWEGINKWVSQIAPEVGDPNVAANRVNVSRAVENYLSTQQAKGRLTADERAEMRQALVSLSAGESYPRAEAVFKRMAKLQRMDAITIAKSGKQPLQPWMFQGLEQSKDQEGPKDFSNLVNSGTLTKEEAATWYEKVNPGSIK